jgi:hypothetical protein
MLFLKAFVKASNVRSDSWNTHRLFGFTNLHTFPFLKYGINYTVHFIDKTKALYTIRYTQGSQSIKFHKAQKHIRSSIENGKDILV